MQYMGTCGIAKAHDIEELFESDEAPVSLFVVQHFVDRPLPDVAENFDSVMYRRLRGLDDIGDSASGVVDALDMGSSTDLSEMDTRNLLGLQSSKPGPDPPKNNPKNNPKNPPKNPPTNPPTSRPTKTTPKGPPKGPPKVTPAPTNIQPGSPSATPTSFPSVKSTPKASSIPTDTPSAKPSAKPSAVPSLSPSAKPSAKPTAVPSISPSSEPTADPSAEPTVDPSAEPTADPSAEPTVDPSAEPTVDPSAAPTDAPIARRLFVEEEFASTTVASSVPNNIRDRDGDVCDIENKGSPHIHELPNETCLSRNLRGFETETELSKSNDVDLDVDARLSEVNLVE